MKVVHFLPTALLNSVGILQDTHVVLASRLAEDPKRAAFYAKRAKEGDRLILVADLGVMPSLGLLSNPTELVVPLASDDLTDLPTGEDAPLVSLLLRGPHEHAQSWSMTWDRWRRHPSVTGLALTPECIALWPDGVDDLLQRLGGMDRLPGRVHVLGGSSRPASGVDVYATDAYLAAALGAEDSEAFWGARKPTKAQTTALKAAMAAAR